MQAELLVRSCAAEVCSAVLGQPSSLIGIPFDRPVVGYGGKTINTLRLWAAAASDYFDFQEFSSGDFVGALAETLQAESLTRVLYPDDSHSHGTGIALRAGVFSRRLLAGRSRAALPRRPTPTGARFPTKSPSSSTIRIRRMAVPELMRILLDDAHLGWDEAWDLTAKDAGLHQPHAAARGAGEMAARPGSRQMLPRHLEIIYEINRRLLDDVRSAIPRRRRHAFERVSLIEEGAERKIRMANLAIVGSHSTNGVAAIHSQLLRTTTVKDLAEMFPERFNNKTNGVTPRRWLLLSNPALSRTITDAIGDGWITDLSQLNKLKPLADDQGLRQAFRKAKRDAKVAVCRLAQADHRSNGRPRHASSIARSSASTNTSGNC